jgi:pimeloyl-ACP methyl ester carboxylesterase
MYDPTIGRWTSEDPVGFSAGDADLYRYVGNNPTNETDPSGKIGIVFDGAGYNASKGSIMGQLTYTLVLGNLEAKNDPNGQSDPQYVKTNIGDLEKKVAAAEDFVLKAVDKNPGEPVDIFGWSRGGIAAIALVHRLAKHMNKDGKLAPIKVRFLGLVDPTAPLKGLDEGKEFQTDDFRKIDDNVQSAALLVRDGKHDDAFLGSTAVGHEGYRLFFKTGNISFAKSTNVLVSEKLPLGHLPIGYSKETWKLLYGAATKAGVAISFGDHPPPWEDPKYNETPKQGEDMAEILRLIIKHVKLND